MGRKRVALQVEWLKNPASNAMRLKDQLPASPSCEPPIILAGCSLALSAAPCSPIQLPQHHSIASFKV